MKRLLSLFSVLLCFVFLFDLCLISSYGAEFEILDYDYQSNGYFIPAPDFPNSESLPYGTDTLIYEIHVPAYNGVAYCRFYLKKDLYNGSEVSAFNGATTCFVTENGKFEAFVASPSTVYYQFYYILDDGSCYFDEVLKAPYYKTKNGKTYNYVVFSGNYANDTVGYYDGTIVSNASCYYGGRDLKSLLDTDLISQAPTDELPAYTSTWFITAYTMSYIPASVASNIDLEASLQSGNQLIVDSVSELKVTMQSVNDSVIENGEKLDDINDSVQENGEKLDGIFEELQENGHKLDTLNATLEETPNKIIEGIKGLFIPTEEEMIAIKDKFDLLMKERFGALYEAGTIVSDISELFNSNVSNKTYITFPTVKLNLAGSVFEFGGWNVKLIPSSKFNDLFSALKIIVSILATFSFVFMLRDKFSKLLGDNTS